MTLVRLEPTAPRSRAKHFTTKPLCSLHLFDPCCQLHQSIHLLDLCCQLRQSIHPFDPCCELHQSIHLFDLCCQLHHSIHLFDLCCQLHQSIHLFDLCCQLRQSLHPYDRVSYCTSIYIHLIVLPSALVYTSAWCILQNAPAYTYV